MNTLSLKVIAVIAVIGGAYYFGYSVAETKGELAITQLKESIYEQHRLEQESVRLEYEKKTKELVANYNSDINRYAFRLRQLESKLKATGDLESVRGERDRCLALAVRGERLLRRADGFIEALK